MNVDLLHDANTESLSILYTEEIGNYLHIIEQAYREQGGIEGQRSPLKTKTAVTIRARMVEDIQKGTILPPIVLGAVVDQAKYEKIQKINNKEDLKSILNELDNDLSIIDGMQRTTAILEANNDGNIASNPVRLEIWVSQSINSLIYRMLILNTGQVPWDIKRQLETIHKPLLAEIQNRITNIEIFKLDDKARRSQSGQYQASRIIEYFLSFSSRKTNVDTKEKIADDFARLAAAEATSNNDFIKEFIEVLELMVKLDHGFGRQTVGLGTGEEFRIASGRDIFTSAPAGHGFLAAAAVHFFGRPGITYAEEKIIEKKESLFTNVNIIIKQLESFTPDQIDAFLDLISLNEKLSRRSGKVGEFEREFYFQAFKVLFEEGDNLSSMTACWEAY